MSKTKPFINNSKSTIRAGAQNDFLVIKLKNKQKIENNRTKIAKIGLIHLQFYNTKITKLKKVSNVRIVKKTLPIIPIIMKNVLVKIQK